MFKFAEYAIHQNKTLGFYERENGMLCLGNMIIIVVELSPSIGRYTDTGSIKYFFAIMRTKVSTFLLCNSIIKIHILSFLYFSFFLVFVCLFFSLFLLLLSIKTVYILQMIPKLLYFQIKCICISALLICLFIFIVFPRN